jgi:3-oxoacyl-[acyl-carrier-protein] synthase II
MKKEIAITGIGVITPNAVGKQNFLTALQQGISGIDEIRSFDSTDYMVHRGGEVRGLETLSIPEALTGRTTQLSYVAIREAFSDAGLHAGNFDAERTGAILGTTSGEVHGIETADESWVLGQQDQLAREIYTSFFTNIISSRIATVFGLRGPVMMLSNACSSGNFAIGLGCELILNDEADIVIAGGVDSLSKTAFAGFSSVHAIAPEICQPFDKNRKGMILGEGAGFLVLEERKHA